MRRVCCAVLFTAFAGHAFAAQEPEDDGSYSIQVGAGVGRFTGNYGEDEKTTLDVLSLNARWFFNRAEFQVSIPYLRIDGGADVRWIDGQPVAIGEGDPDAQREESGLGDVVLRGEYYVLTGSRTRPWIIGLVRVKLPSGSESLGLGSGATDVETGIGLIQRQGSINWMADAGYIFVGTDGDTEASNELRLGGGASVSFGSNDRHSTYLYFENRTNRFDGPDRRSIAVGAGTAFKQAKRLRLSASVFFGLTDSTEDVGAYLTLAHRY